MYETLLITIVSGLVGCGGFWALIQNSLERKEKRSNEPIEKLSKTVAELTARVEQTFNVSMSYSRDRLNHLCLEYMNKGYVPKDDYVSFKLLGEAYKDANGNSEVKTRFDYCMDNLEVK